MCSSPKQLPSELAAFGGAPAFPEPLHVGRPNVGDRERLLARLAEVIDSRRLSNDGPFQKAFEEQVRRLAGAAHAVAFANATLALQLTLRALGLSGEVILPAWTFIATANAVAWEGLVPVFCDVDPKTHLLDVRDVEARITDRTSAIVAVHLWGHACPTEELEALARRRGLALIFDGAQALGTRVGGRALGREGRATVFSFHATKIVNSFEGGVLTTDDAELAGALRRSRNHGFADYDRVEGLGLNAKLNEAQAAMGMTSLESLEDFLAVNRRNFEVYRRLLAAVPSVRLVESRAAGSNHHYVVVELDDRPNGLERDQLVGILHAENVLARRYFHPGCHHMQPYATQPAYRDVRLPHTEQLARRVLTLPTGTAVGPDEIEVICHLIGFALEHASEIRRRLSDARAPA